MDRDAARARMLRLWAAMGAAAGRPVSIRTTQRTLVTADAVAVNAKQTLLGASGLRTPLGTYAHAVLRDYDVSEVARELSAGELRRRLRSSSRS